MPESPVPVPRSGSAISRFPWASRAGPLRYFREAVLPALVPEVPHPQRALGWSPSLLFLAAPAILFLLSCGAVGVPAAGAWTVHPKALFGKLSVGNSENRRAEDSDLAVKEGEDDVEWQREFERWKSKTYALTVTLRVVALHGSFPPAWIKMPIFIGIIPMWVVWLYAEWLGYKKISGASKITLKKGKRTR